MADKNAAERLAALREKAGILGVDISDLGDNVEAIQSRISSYHLRSASNASRRGGFSKTAAAVTSPEQVEIPAPAKLG